MKKLVLAFTTSLAACNGPTTITHTKYVPGPEVPVEVLVPVPGPEVIVEVEVPAPTPEPTEAELLIEDENAYRDSIGQLPLTNGITCYLYDLRNSAIPVPPQPQPNLFPTALPGAKAAFGYKGDFNQASSAAEIGSLVVPSALRSQYTSWYALRCQGLLVVTDSGFQKFNLSSDDAGLLYINNVLIVNNDGHHGMQEREGSIQLHRGVHSIRLDYMAGNGVSGLILKINNSAEIKELLYR